MTADEIQFPVSLPPRVFADLVAYLQMRPWQEVNTLIHHLAGAARASAPDNEVG